MGQNVKIIVTETVPGLFLLVEPDVGASLMVVCSRHTSELCLIRLSCLGKPACGTPAVSNESAAWQQNEMRL